MKIAVLAAADSIHSRRWVDYFASRGHEVLWLSLAPFTGAVTPGVRACEVDPYFTAHYDGTDPDTARTLASPRGLWATVRGARRARRLLAEAGVELLHVHSVGAYGLVAALCGFHPLIATPWGSDVLVAAKSGIRRPLIKYILRNADTLTCDAYHMKGELERLGVVPHRIHVIFFGTDCRKFRPGLDGSAIRARLGIGDRPMILSTRSLLPIYDIGTLVRAMAEVARHAPDARCVVVGRGSEREALEALAGALGVGDRVQFVGGVTGEEMPLYLAAADVYVSTSLSDAGLAASTAEAMAVGLPCVVTDSAENRMWVEEGKGGFVIPVKDPQTLAARLVHLLGHPEERRGMGAFNRPVIEQRNNTDVEMEKIARLYAGVAARPSGDER